MLVTGISIDQSGTGLVEDGFVIEKFEDHYVLKYAVVDVGSKIHSYEDFLTGHSRQYLYPENEIRKKDLSFCDSPRDAFIFKVVISNKGQIDRFSPYKGSFQLSAKYSFDVDLSNHDFSVATECMDTLSETGLYPFLSRSNSANQLLQNINLFMSLSLFDYMVRKVGVSVICTGVTAGQVVGGTELSYRDDAGRLCILNSNYGMRIINGEGFLVRAHAKRCWIYNDSDIGAGTYIMSISSPFRNDDALINQIILSAYLDGAEPQLGQCGFKLFGPSVKCRDRYLQLTNRSGEFKQRSVVTSKALEMSAKLLKDFVSLLVDYNLESKQIDKLSANPQTSINDQVVICSYYLGRNIPLPPKLHNWMRSISIEGSATTGTFLHVLSGLPFVTACTNGGVASLDINNRLFEVDECSGYKVRLMRKLHDGVCRERFELPSGINAKKQLINRLIDDPEILKYLKRKGVL